MEVEVNLHGRLAEALGSSVRVPLDGAAPTVADLLRAAGMLHPAIDADRTLVAIDDRFARGDAPVAAGRRIDLMPPLSGG